MDPPDIPKKDLLNEFGSRKNARYPTKRKIGIPEVHLVKMED